MKNFKLALIATAIVTSASGVAVAATDGTLDLTSTGTSIVTIIKQNAVQITNVDDLNLGTHYALSADEVASDDVCVFSSTGTYDITMSSAAAAGFELDDSAGNTLAYSVAWTGDGVAGPTPVVSGTTIGATFSGDATSPNCGGSTNASFEVTVAQGDFNAAVNGTYTDTLTLLVSPQ